MALFGKSKKEEKKTVPILSPSEQQNRGSSISQPNQNDLGEIGKTLKALPKEYGVLKGFYVSEKATSLSSFNQYVFKVFKNTTKNEVKKQVENSFSVKVEGVKIINLPRKSRTVGRHRGFKSGAKKAIVVLKEGYSIDQAKA